MGSYVPRGTPVEAYEVNDQTAAMIATWIGGRVISEHDLDGKEQLSVNVPTLEGVVRASQGEFVVKDQDGDVKVYGPHRFNDVYKETT